MPSSRMIYFIERYDPDYIVVLSGDHIYKMDYSQYDRRYHEEKGADATIAVIEVPMEEASRFGIMNTEDDLCEFTSSRKSRRSLRAIWRRWAFMCSTWKVVKRIS